MQGSVFALEMWKVEVNTTGEITSAKQARI